MKKYQKNYQKKTCKPLIALLLAASLALCGCSSSSQAASSSASETASDGKTGSDVSKSSKTGAEASDEALSDEAEILDDEVTVVEDSDAEDSDKEDADTEDSEKESDKDSDAEDSEEDAEDSSSTQGGLLLGSGSGQDVSVESTVFEDTKFGAAKVNLSLDDMNAVGFSLGDSCDIEFGNGYVITDVPFYNGYYVKNGAPVIVAYPGSPNISITYNNLGIWSEINLSEGDAVTITMNTAGKYLDVQEVLGQIYSFDRTDYTSDENFCNFRALSGGNLKANYFYRGASPVDNSRKRAPYTDVLLQNYGINFIIDLADTQADIDNYAAQDDFNSPYAKSLIDNGQAILLGMGSSYQSQTYKEQVVAGFRTIINNEGPFYIHCMEGKDRTGFVCLILEALAGATLEELMQDYMKTYENYYKVSEETTPEKYSAIKELYFDAFTEFLLELSFMSGDDVTLLAANSGLLEETNTESLGDMIPEEWKTRTYVQNVENYLLGGGMSQDEINQLKAAICE